MFTLGIGLQAYSRHVQWHSWGRRKKLCCSSELVLHAMNGSQGLLYTEAQIPAKLSVLPKNTSGLVYLEESPTMLDKFYSQGSRLWPRLLVPLGRRPSRPQKGICVYSAALKAKTSRQRAPPGVGGVNSPASRRAWWNFRISAKDTTGSSFAKTVSSSARSSSGSCFAVAPATKRRIGSPTRREVAMLKEGHMAMRRSGRRRYYRVEETRDRN